MHPRGFSGAKLTVCQEILPLLSAKTGKSLRRPRRRQILRDFSGKTAKKLLTSGREGRPACAGCTMVQQKMLRTWASATRADGRPAHGFRRRAESVGIGRIRRGERWQLASAAAQRKPAPCRGGRHRRPSRGGCGRSGRADARRPAAPGKRDLRARWDFPPSLSWPARAPLQPSLWVGTRRFSAMPSWRRRAVPDPSGPRPRQTSPPAEGFRTAAATQAAAG